LIESYDIARKNLALAEETSCLDSSDNDEKRRPRRNKGMVPQRFADESDSDIAPPKKITCLPRPDVPSGLTVSSIVTNSVAGIFYC
jgi:hypothetical protein